jgi:hypothetical protein
MDRDQYLAALLREQAGLMSFGDSRRLADVDAEIRRVKADARSTPPVGRSAVPLETAAVKPAETTSVEKPARRRGGQS